MVFLSVKDMVLVRVYTVTSLKTCGYYFDFFFTGVTHLQMEIFLKIPDNFPSNSVRKVMDFMNICFKTFKSVDAACLY